MGSLPSVDLDGVTFRVGEAPVPQAAFSAFPSSGLAPFNVSFTDESSNAPTSWFWNFGDGATSTLQNPIHFYANPGLYTVTLTVTNFFGSSTATGTIRAGSTASFTASPMSGVDPFTVTFTDTTPGTVVSWAWDFGDGGSSVAQNPVHLYPTGPVTYTVTLTVTDVFGNVTSATDDVTDLAVVAAFTASPASGPDPFTVTFTDTSLGAVVSWAWTFGDGGTSTLQNPVHAYAAGAATYPVTLTVTDAYGDTDLVSHNVIDTGGAVTSLLLAARAGPATTSDLYQIDPVTAAEAAIGPIGFAVTGLAVDPTTGILYGFTSGNSAAHPGALISINPVTGAGTFIGAPGNRVGDIAFDAGGTIYGVENNFPRKLLRINKATGAGTAVGSSFALSFGCGLDFDGANVLYASLDGDNGNLRTINTGTGAGTLGAALTNSPFGPSEGAAIGAATFDHLGVLWACDNDFGAAVYLVTIDVGTGVITTVGPMENTAPFDALVWAPTIRARFSPTPANGPDPFTVTFTDQSWSLDSTIVSWAWTFGDGGTSALQNPVHAYAAGAASYTVGLTVTDGLGRTASISHVVTDTGTATSRLFAAIGGSFGTSDLYELDPLTGAATSIGPIGFALTGLAQDPTTGTLYGVTSSNSTAHPRSLVSVDPSTGAGTFIGIQNVGTNLAGDIGFNASGQLWGMFQSAKVGSIDKATGQATLNAHTNGTLYGGACDFDGGDVFHTCFDRAAGHAWTVDLVSGVATSGAVLTGSPLGDVPLNAASYTLDKATFYALVNNFGSPVHLATVNLSTGVITDVGAVLDGMDALAWTTA